MRSENLMAPTRNGFFGLHELHGFFKEQVEPVFQSKRDYQVILNFSDVTYWDISALLWVVIALDHFQKSNQEQSKDLQFKLCLPQPTHDDLAVKEMSDRDRALLRSADYLRRWKFYDALQNISNNPDELFLDTQKEYIKGNGVDLTGFVRYSIG